MSDKRLWIVDINYEFWNLDMNLEVWERPPLFWNYETAKEHFFNYVGEVEKVGYQAGIQYGSHGVITAAFDGLEAEGLITYDLRWKNVPDITGHEKMNTPIIWGLDIHAHALKYPMMYANFELAKERFNWYTREYKNDHFICSLEYGEKQQLYATFKDKKGKREVKLDLVRLNVNGNLPVGKYLS